MPQLPRRPLADALIILAVLVLAGGSRGWYLWMCADQGKAAPMLEVQSQAPLTEIPSLPPGEELRGRPQPGELDCLVHNLEQHRWYGCWAPLSKVEERTAHVAPGYPWLFFLVQQSLDQPERVMRLAQGVLGALTAVCMYFFALRAFYSRLAAGLTGLFCALHPFWIINTGELSDGVIVTFLLALGLMLGTRASQVGGVLGSLLFGLALAGLAMVRAALLPFSLVAMLWFLLRCRKVRMGWFCALLGVLGFANGLAPWAVRNFRAFGEPVPIVTSSYLHLWMGNNPQATGGYLDERALRQSLPPERLQELLDEPNQAVRYAMLGHDLVEEISADPESTVRRRLWSGLVFFFGESWFKTNTLSRDLTPESAVAPTPLWVLQTADGILAGSLLLMLLLGSIGWRWSHAWRRQGRLGVIAMLWIPLPYLLTHAEWLSGPRLPLDGVLLAYAAFTIACLVPGTARQPWEDDSPREPKKHRTM